MISLFTKWGSAIVLIFVIGTIIIGLLSGPSGISNWLGDSYLPKKYLLVEYGGMRLLLYGQFGDSNVTNKVNNMIKAFSHLPPLDRNYTYPVNINIGSDFNSRQIRSSNRAKKIIDKYIDVAD